MYNWVIIVQFLSFLFVRNLSDSTAMSHSMYMYVKGWATVHVWITWSFFIRGIFCLTRKRLLQLQVSFVAM